MFANINTTAFIIAFAAGIFFIYMFTPPPNVVVKFPTPWNAGHVVYTGDNPNTCFVYKASKTSCPIDESLIRPQPYVQFDDVM